MDQVRQIRLNRSTAVKVAAGLLVISFVIGLASPMLLPLQVSSQVRDSGERGYLEPSIPPAGFGGVRAGNVVVEKGVPAPIVDLPIPQPPLELVRENQVEVGIGLPGPAALPFQQVPAVGSERFVVRTAAIAVNVTNVQKSVADLDFLAASMGGYVSQSSISPIPRGTPLPRGILKVDSFQAYVTLRVPSDKYSTAVSSILDMGLLISMSSSTSDVTESYVDLQARITNSERVLEQYRLILSKADKIGDIIAVQGRIDQIQEQIERLKGSLKQLENQISYASVTVSLVQPQVVEEIGEKKEISPFEQIFNETVTFASLTLQVVFRGLLILIIGFLPIYPFLGLGYLLYRRYGRAKSLEKDMGSSRASS